MIATQYDTLTQCWVIVDKPALNERVAFAEIVLHAH